MEKKIPCEISKSRRLKLQFATILLFFPVKINKIGTQSAIFASMKFFTLIMSLFLLYISCLPCGDRLECNAKTEQKISANTNHQQHKHTSEACTPFCTCSCCAASILFLSLTKAQSPKLIFTLKNYPIVNDSFFSQDFSFIWQPPKLR